MELIIIAVLVLETSIMFGWCMSQRISMQTIAASRDHWHSQANVLSEDLHELKEENTSLGQLLDDYKRTITEQQQQLSEHEKTLRNVREWITAELKGDI